MLHKHLLVCIQNLHLIIEVNVSRKKCVFNSLHWKVDFFNGTAWKTFRKASVFVRRCVCKLSNDYSHLQWQERATFWNLMHKLLLDHGVSSSSNKQILVSKFIDNITNVSHCLYKIKVYTVHTNLSRSWHLSLFRC